MLVTIVWISNSVLVALISFLLILVHAKSAIQEIQSNEPVSWHSVSSPTPLPLYVRPSTSTFVTPGERSVRANHVTPSQLQGATLDDQRVISGQKIQDIFNVKEKIKPVVYNSSNLNAFIIQRTPDGKLSAVLNNTTIPAPDASPSSFGQNNIKPGIINQAAPGRDIIFPGDRPNTNLIFPKCIQSDTGFCTEVSNYPAAHVEQILKADLNKYEQLFGDDLVPTQSINLTQRIDAPGEESLCESSERLIYPQAGITKDNNWSFIINHENRTQGIRVEECLNPGKPCSMMDNFAIGYKPECRQKYIYRQLLSYNAEGHVVKGLFRLPSCCKCILTAAHRFKRQTPAT